MAKVIVVDDDPLVLDLIAQLVRKLGHEAWKATNAADVLALLGGPGHFDLVILDVVLHGMSGIDLARRIQARFPCVATIAISGYINDNSTDVVETLRGIGVTEILCKPIDPFFLGPAIRQALRSRE